MTLGFFQREPNPTLRVRHRRLRRGHGRREQSRDDRREHDDDALQHRITVRVIGRRSPEPRARSRRGGLCDGVTTMPSASPVWRPRFSTTMAWEMTGVGVTPSSRWTIVVTFVRGEDFERRALGRTR